MDHSHFSDDRIDEIRSGKSMMTIEEREFLLVDTPHMEECTYTAEELAAMSDSVLMETAYSAWADYARCMF